MKSNKDPHPPLRGTFSRHPEKALTLKSRRDAHRQSPRPRERERVAGGRVRVSASDSMKSKKDPHPPLRGTFSRHREKALTMKSRCDAHRQSPRPRERERVAGGRVRVPARIQSAMKQCAPWTSSSSARQAWSVRVSYASVCSILV